MALQENGTRCYNFRDKKLIGFYQDQIELLFQIEILLGTV